MQREPTFRTSRDFPLDLARGAALFFGLYSLFGLVISLRHPGFDPNLWWIDLRMLPVPAANVALGIFAIAALAFALRPPRGHRAKFFIAVIMSLFAFAAFYNAATVWRLAVRGAIAVPFWLPLSAIFGVLLVWIVKEVLSARLISRARPAVVIATAAAMMLSFPLLQVFAFGKTDYTRRADIAVVFGARVYADGRLSDALEDRVATAASLYKRGMVQHLVMSGGRGNGAIHEAEAMRRRAIQLGVRDEAISLDLAGDNTAATVLNTMRLADASAWRRIVVVSEFYHLPRIKLAYASRGVDVFTVPARPRHWARRWAVKNVAREVPAFWLYMARGAVT